MTKSMDNPQYGIDAPDLLRFFIGAGTGSLVILIAVLLMSVLNLTLKIIVVSLLGLATSYFLGMGCLMLFYSKVTKLQDRDYLLNLVTWSGNELVLDVGCGRGLMLIGAAKRLVSGKAIGIDLWQEKDQADNNPEAAMSNALIDGVAERVEIETGDMRELPFPEDFFDVIVSSWSVHNLEVERDRQKALAEIVRVLKPNGQIVLADIINQVEYADYLRTCGMKDLKLHNNNVRDAILKAVSFGSFAPFAISAHKSL